MAKANKKAQDLKQLNQNFDNIKDTLQEIAYSTEKIMPLVSKSLSLTVEIVKMYKDAFNRGLE